MSQPNEVQAQPVEEVGADAVLTTLASVLQRGLIESVGVTVTVAGTVISGLAIGRDRWFDRLAEGAAAAGEEAGKIVGALRDGVRTSAAEAEENGEPMRYGYLHLQDAFVESTRVEMGPMMWRVRISEVSAWSLVSRPPAP